MMLSDVYRLAREFEQEHGYPPTLLYIHPRHLQHLKSQLQNQTTRDLSSLLGLQIIVSTDILHAHAGAVRLRQVSSGA